MTNNAYTSGVAAPVIVLVVLVVLDYFAFLYVFVWWIGGLDRYSMQILIKIWGDHTTRKPVSPGDKPIDNSITRKKKATNNPTSSNTNCHWFNNFGTEQNKTETTHDTQQ